MWGPSLRFLVAQEINKLIKKGKKKESQSPVSLILLGPSCIFIKECILISVLGLQ
jgi:hypothetical protein